MKLMRAAGTHYHTAEKKTCLFLSMILDFTSGGIFQSILGQGHPAIRKVLRDERILTSCYAPHHTNPWTERYRDMLKEWTGFESVALFTTGAEATEAFWRCMRVYSGKIGIWGGLIDPDEVGTDGPLSDSMHGQTLGAQIMAGKVTEATLGIGPAMGETRFGLAPEMTSGMIMEPYHSPSAQFHKIDPTINRIISLQKEFPEIPLCVDEIQGGFGRTGKQFAYEWYSARTGNLPLRADFITIGKGAGAGMPLSALLGPKDIMESKVVKEHAHMHSTHSGHPLMCAVGCAVIEEMDKHYLITRSYNLGLNLKEGLEDCGVRYHAGRGLLAGLEFKDAKEARRMVKACQKRGLLVVDTGRKWVKIGPALTITEDELETGIQIIRDAIEEVLDGRP